MRSVGLERDSFTVWFALMCCGLVAWPAYALAQTVLPTARYPVGMTQVEYIDPADGGRPLNYMLIYRLLRTAAPRLSKYSYPPICNCIRTHRSLRTG